jgi:hypothetical protein
MSRVLTMMGLCADLGSAAMTVMNHGSVVTASVIVGASLLLLTTTVRVADRMNATLNNRPEVLRVEG